MSQSVSQQLRHPSRTDQQAGQSEVDADELLSLLGDEYARQILEVIAETPRSGREIVEQTGFSKATVYRRLDRLEDAALVDSQTVFDPDGHHRERFETAFSGATCNVDSDGLETTIHLTENN